MSSRSGTLVETVVDGKTGFLVEKNNAAELADALLVLLKDDDRREAMGRAGTAASDGALYLGPDCRRDAYPVRDFVRLLRASRQLARLIMECGTPGPGYLHIHGCLS